ncbi:MAG TPA: glycerophosphoryl diester phosphodiesterase membrane domain-containing protein, partial [Microbacterium sp.]|nr:glycerophosphoryl diester phosphodiesterase membrane domain-containing protein [Microbacterium sp.]
MTAYPAWTPASRPGIIPLHPLTFGAILGRSFAALRQNPRVLLGFALCVQTVAYVVVLVALGGVAWASFSRLDTVQPGSDEFNAIMAGSIAITSVAGIVLGFAAMALSVIVQGVVVTEVSHAVVAEKLPLGALWRQIRPVTWRLIGYSLILIAAMVAAFAVVGAAVFGLATVAPPAAVGLGVLVVLAFIPLTLWLSTKLFLVPSAIILERATIRIAIGRSWRLTRGRFWSTLGIIVLLNLVFSGIAQVISLPFSFLSTGLTTVIAPTGDTNVTAIITLLASALLTQAVVLLVQSVALVVQSTAAALVYIDCRMRHEGLDLDLLAYVERRDAGATGLADPYLEHIGRETAPRGFTYPQPSYAPAPGYAYSQAPVYGGQPGPYPVGYGHAAGYPGQQPYGQAAGYPGQQLYGQAPGYARSVSGDDPPGASAG